MTYIKAPFNFVPFKVDNIFYPSWADKISHDVPFENECSGKLSIKIKACSPVFVRNGNLEGPNTDSKDDSFSNHQGKHLGQAVDRHR